MKIKYVFLIVNHNIKLEHFVKMVPVFSTGMLIFFPFIFYC